MTDAPSKKRGWFQLHLSTCVVLMFVAGVMVASNVVGRHDVSLKRNGGVESDYVVYGWPAVAYAEYRVRPEIDPKVDGLSSFIVYEEVGWATGALMIDFSVAIIIVLAVAAVCESVTHRRDREAQNSAPQ